MKISYIRSYMFRSTCTILRELTLSLAKVTLLQNSSVKIHRYKFCSVVAARVNFNVLYGQQKAHLLVKIILTLSKCTAQQ
jgi:hypothetical protein